ncbi:Retrovirus-related Pol polyprotein from transposon 17.6 [Vitis vinifera]|uniref:Retrovirus-related Pol polyprotein from transposon 17.6 n=1 Tax=Vitis vinifera TaxID=29760 RepID=A0A438JQT2_VITVI|nr:Retrovirus-related Pol polyprotein from transposon 17.6 [Vitis vinifera]
MKSQPNALNAKAGMYTLNEDIDMKAKVAAMTRRLEELELKKIREVQAVSETPVQVMPCSICQSYEHLVEECPTIPIVREMFGDQANVIGQFKPITMLHMEIPTIQIGGTIQISPRNQEHFSTHNQAKHLNKLQILSKQYAREGKVSFSTSPKPKGIHEVEAHEGESSQVRDVKAMITLRSGKEVELPTPKPHDETESEKETEKREEIKGKKKGAVEGKRTMIQYVEASEGQHPLLDMIKQVSTYAKFLKDLCTIKRGLNVNKKAFLISNGETLLDLGASVNLLPYSVYKQLGLGELKPTSITLSLADRSVKIPRGMIEDVLVQVDNFYYPVDFVVLDTTQCQRTNYVPIILGRPFLATSNAIINCRNGLMQLTFGNMTLELNIFYMCKKPINPEEEEGLPEPSYLLATLPPWRRIEEILPLFNEEETQEAVKEEAPKLILKPLPTELKYAYLEENKKCPVVISSSLTTPQEECFTSRIFLGHIISKKDIEVDKAKDAKFVWDERCQKSFKQLKQFLTTAPIMRAPNWQLPFEVMCDASDFAIGAVLGQREDGKPYVIYYASKTLNEVQRNYTTTKKELLAVVFALDKFRAYLVGSFIVVFTDHSTLKYLLTKQDAKARLIRWILLLQEFNLQIKDKKGVENVVADHLSRSCDRCQRLGKLTRRNQMPMNPILIVDLFDVWGIDFMGPFPIVVLKFLKENIFSRFGVPKAIISVEQTGKSEYIDEGGEHEQKRLSMAKHAISLWKLNTRLGGQLRRKLKSRWIGPFIIHQVHSNGVVELLNSNSTDTFKVNGHRLKPFMEPFNQDKEEVSSLSHNNLNQKGVDGLSLSKD